MLHVLCIAVARGLPIDTAAEVTVTTIEQYNQIRMRLRHDVIFDQ